LDLADLELVVRLQLLARAGEEIEWRGLDGLS
jgi:hypothetical protein